MLPCWQRPRSRWLGPSTWNVADSCDKRGCESGISQAEVDRIVAEIETMTARHRRQLPWIRLQIAIWGLAFAAVVVLAALQMCGVTWP